MSTGPRPRAGEKAAFNGPHARRRATGHCGTLSPPFVPSAARTRDRVPGTGSEPRVPQQSRPSGSGHPPGSVPAPPAPLP